MSLLAPYALTLPAGIIGIGASMPLPDDALDRRSLVQQLDALREADLPWRGGRVLAYVYDPGKEIEEIAKAAYASFLGENALDPTVFPSLLRLENDVIGWVRDHLRGGPEIQGSFTSGGTESCLLAVKAARDHLLSRRPGARPNLVLPVTAHAAFHKAAHYFGLGLRLVPVGADFRVAAEEIEARIDADTALVVASAPSYAHGVVDPIEAIGAVAKRRGVLLHVDACIGGWMLPLFRDLGVEVPAFDWTVPGVTSMSVDLHKYAYCPKGASVVLYRDEDLRRFQYFAAADWTGYSIVNPTFQSTKSGGPIAGAWATLRAFGRTGYLRLAADVLAGTRAILAGIEAIDGLRLLVRPDGNLIAFEGVGLSVFHVCDEMRLRGWFVQAQLGYHGSRANAHLSVPPQSAGFAADFLSDLRESVDAARLLPPPPDHAQVHQLWDAIQASGGGTDMIFAAAGLDGTQLPERMALVSHLLDGLPPAATAELLKAYFSKLYRAGS